jgi:hypothetical protein
VTVDCGDIGTGVGINDVVQRRRIVEAINLISELGHKAVLEGLASL